jgi:hypothetical protein
VHTKFRACQAARCARYAASNGSRQCVFAACLRLRCGLRCTVRQIPCSRLKIGLD